MDEKSGIKEESSLNVLTSDERKLGFEQYKLLIESINKSNDIREISNNFWTTINALLISGIAYIKDARNIKASHKSTFLWIMIFLGIILCFTWLNYLINIRKTEETCDKILKEIEPSFPFKIFTRINLSRRREGKGSLTLIEMMVPLLFFIGYIFFIITLLFFTKEVITPSH